MPRLSMLLLALMLTSAAFADPPDRARLDAWVETLGAAQWKGRQNAERALRKAGAVALPALRARVDDADLERRRRVRALIAAIERDIAIKALKLELTLTASATRGTVEGTPIALRARLRNTGRTPITVCGALDGSLLGWRCASYRFEVLSADGTPAKRLKLYGCKTVNPLRGADFKVLAPGGSVDPFGPGQFGTRRLDRWFALPPGRYRARLLYTFDRSNRRYKGRPAPAGFDQALAGEWASAWVPFTVTAAPAKRAPAGKPPAGK